MVASVFWGFYESAEIRFVEKYFTGGVDAIELGASSGIVSSHIISKLKNNERQFIAVEANHYLQSICFENIKRQNSKAKISQLNYAIHYGNESIRFAISEDPTVSGISVSGMKGNNAIEIKTTTLKKILQTQNIGTYALFCDIEGAEIEIFFNEEEALDSCKFLFIELHDTKYNCTQYTTRDLSLLIEKKGFRIVDQYGPVYYFEKHALNW